MRYHTKVARYILYGGYTWKCEVSYQGSLVHTLLVAIPGNVRYHTKVARYILYCNCTWKCEVSYLGSLVHTIGVGSKFDV